MGEYQQQVAELCKERGYTDDLLTLALGLCEEAGEVAAAVDDLNPKYKANPGRVKSDLESELRDCLTYLCAIANTTGIDLGI